MRRISILTFALSLLACGGEEASPGATTEPEAQEAEPTAESAETPDEADTTRAETPTLEADEPPQPTLPSPEEGQVHVFVVPEGGELMLRLDSDVTYAAGEFECADERLARILDGRVAELERAALASANMGDAWAEISSSCEVPLASSHLVSVACFVTAYDEREYSETKSFAYHLRIDDGAVYDMALADVFVPGTDLDVLVRDECARYNEEEEGEVRCADFDRGATVSLGETGLIVRVFSESEPTEFEVMYEDLSEHLVASGPLALSFDRTGLTTRALDVEPGAVQESSIREVERWAALPMGPVTELAAAWATLPAEQREATSIVGGYLVGSDEAAARAAARALGTEAAQVHAHLREGVPPMELRLVRTNREVPVREAGNEDADVVRTLPRGTILVATEAPSQEARGYAHVIAHGELEGYVEGRRLESDGICVPDIVPFLATRPESARLATRTRTLRTSLAQGSWGRATYVAEVEGSTHVEVRRIEDGCSVDRSLARFSRAGSFEQLTITRTARRGGESLIVTVTGGSERAVSAHSFGSAEPVWTRPLGERDRVETSVREEESWFPIVVHPASGSPIQIVWGEDGPAINE